MNTMSESPVVTLRAMEPEDLDLLYQIENEEMHSSVSAWFMECLTKLYENDIDGVDGWWGEIEI